MMRIGLLMGVLALAAPTASADEYVIKAAKVYTQTGVPLAPGAVRVKDGKIVEVAGEIAVPAGAKVIDLGKGTLLPGLVDACNTFAIEGGTAEQTLEVTPDFRVANGVDWSAKSFRAANGEGTTTVCLVPGTDNVVAGLTAIVKSAGPPKLRFVSKEHSLMITTTGDPASGNSARNRPDSIYARQPTNRMGVNWILRSEFGRAKANGPSAIRDAIDGKRPVVCAARQDNEITTALRLLHDYPMKLSIAGGHEAYKVRGELAAAKIPVLLARQTTTPGSGGDGTETILNNAGLLHEAKVSFAFTGGQLLDQARFAVRHGLPADVALAAVTSTPAKLLGIANRVGAIAVGQDADLVALTGDPFELTSAVRWTMTDGAIRPEDQ